MLRTVRERSTRSLVASRLPFLLEATYRAMFALLNDLAIAQAVIDQLPVLFSQFIDLWVSKVSFSEKNCAQK